MVRPLRFPSTPPHRPTDRIAVICSWPHLQVAVEVVFIVAGVPVSPHSGLVGVNEQGKSVASRGQWNRDARDGIDGGLRRRRSAVPLRLLLDLRGVPFLRRRGLLRLVLLLQLLYDANRTCCFRSGRPLVSEGVGDGWKVRLSHRMFVAVSSAKGAELAARHEGRDTRAIVNGLFFFRQRYAPWLAHGRAVGVTEGGWRRGQATRRARSVVAGHGGLHGVLGDGKLFMRQAYQLWGHLWRRQRGAGTSAPAEKDLRLRMMDAFPGDD